MWYRCFFQNAETGVSFYRDIENPDFDALRGAFQPAFQYSDQLPGKPYGPKELYDFFSFPRSTDASIARSTPESLLFEIKKQVGYANYWELFPQTSDGLNVDYLLIAMEIQDEARKRAKPSQNPNRVIEDLLAALDTLEHGWRILYLIPAEDELPRIVKVAIQNAKDYLEGKVS